MTPPTRAVAFAVGALCALILLPALASAHVERPSYWPDPAPDQTVSPPAGGKVPKLRSLGSAISGKGPGEVRVVCRGRHAQRSLYVLDRALARATSKGFKLRPSQPTIVFSQKRATKLRKQNKILAKRCRYRSIQAAVLDSGNNGRVVIMPGRYPERHSRKQLENDPACAGLTQMTTGGSQAPSVAYHAKCPNDQNLIYIQGRAVKGAPPSPPLGDRHGIPDAGSCLRCNFQIEGSGTKPTDVIIDAAKRGVDHRPAGEPGDPVKDVVLRADRTDGFVAHNFTVKGALEHGLYIEEADGYLIDGVKFFWNDDYGNLTFTSDHGLYRNCDGYGSGDSVVYPGAAPETGEQATSFYPDAPRYNTTVKKCDLRGSALAYSGSMGNAVRITENNIYGNGTGIASDTISAGGHPGYPLDSMEIDHNYIYSNNLNLYRDANPPVDPRVGVPSGVGIIIAGGNNIDIHDNWIFDNWMRGTMLLAVPDAILTPEGDVDPGVSCSTAPSQSTSCNNRYFNNHMGEIPPGFVFPKPKDIYPYTDGVGPRYVGAGATTAPNGVDFYWDEFVTNTGNCWFNNVGSAGDHASLTGDPAINPVPGLSAPGFLPEECGSSVGQGDAAKEAVLLDCSTWSRGNTQADHPACDWFTDKPRPATAAFRRAQRRQAAELRDYEQSQDGRGLQSSFDVIAGQLDFGALQLRPSSP